MELPSSALITVFTALLLAGCASGAPGPRARSNFKYGFGDGQTTATAVQVRTPSETEGGMLIRDWIHANYPGFAIRQQDLLEQRGRAYDLITLVGPGDTMHRVYFDISAYYRRIGNDTLPKPLP